VSKHETGDAQVYPVVGRKGYAIVFEASNHQELLRFLYGNSMTFDEEYRVFPLTSIDHEVAALRDFNHI
jgi:hypothetical protein